MNPSLINTLHQTRCPQNQPRSEQQQDADQGLFACTLRHTIESRQVEHSAVGQRAGRADRQEEILKNQDRDPMKDISSRDSLAACAIHPAHSCAPSSLDEPGQENSDGAAAPLEPKINDNVQQILAGHHPSSASEEKNKTFNASKHQTNLHVNHKNRIHPVYKRFNGHLSPEAIAVDEISLAAIQDHDSQQAIATLLQETTEAAPLSKPGLDAGPLTGVAARQSVVGLDAENSQDLAKLATSDNHLGTNQSVNDSAFLTGKNLEDLSFGSLSAADERVSEQAVNDRVASAQILAENSSFATASGGTSSRTIFSQAFPQTGIVSGEDAGPVSFDQQQEVAADGQASGFSLTGYSDSIDVVRGLEAANAMSDSDRHSVQLPGQAVASMLLMVRGGRQTLQVRLHPDHFGELRINLVNGSDGLSVQLTTDTLSACQLLEANLPQLQQALLEKQIVCREIDVQYKQPEQQSGFEQTAGEGSRQGSPYDPGRQSQMKGQIQPASDHADEPVQAMIGRAESPSHLYTAYRLDHLA